MKTLLIILGMIMLVLGGVIGAFMVIGNRFKTNMTALSIHEVDIMR